MQSAMAMRQDNGVMMKHKKGTADDESLETVRHEEKIYLMQTYKRQPIVICKGEGCYVEDTAGRNYLDMTGALATAPLGYGNKGFAKSLGDQAKLMINATNLYYTKEQVELARMLTDISGLQKVFFANSGSEANDVAIKLARKCTGKKKIVAAKGGFHGRTYGALSATWNSAYKDYCKPLVPGFVHVPYNDVKALNDALCMESLKNDVAAFIVEPIQGESGVIVPDEGYLRRVSEICKRNDILLIVDEVQTNMRTGKWFAFQHENIEPDIITIAKGLGNGIPISAVMATQKVGSCFRPGDQGSTFGGGSLACKASLSTLETAKNEKLVENAGIMGELLMLKLQELKQTKESIYEVRGKGLMIGLELNSENASDMQALCLQNGLLVNNATTKVLRMLPSLIIGESEIQECIRILDKVLK